MDMLHHSSASFIELAAIRPHSARPGSARPSARVSIDDAEKRAVTKTSVTAHDPYGLTSRLVDERRMSGDNKELLKFYKYQNAKIKDLLTSVDGHRLAADEAESDRSLKTKIAIYGSLAANLVLAGLQLYGAVSSGSLALFAAMVDSIFDPVSNLIMLYCHRSAKKHDERNWPSGKARLTTVGNLCFCGIMSCASAILIVESIRDIVEHLADANAADKDTLHVPSIVAVAVAFGTKLVLMLYCLGLRKSNSQVSMLFEDHRNDLLVNGSAITFSVLATKVSNGWFLDPMGAIILSLVIITLWLTTAYKEFALLIGRSASPDFLQLLTYTCLTFSDSILALDTCRAYHSGEGIIIEADIVMSKEATLFETHAVSEDLQMALERLPGVERCYVHVDWETRHRPEHRKQD